MIFSFLCISINTVSVPHSPNPSDKESSKQSLEDSYKNCRAIDSLGIDEARDECSEASRHDVENEDDKTHKFTDFNLRALDAR